MKNQQHLLTIITFCVTVLLSGCGVLDHSKAKAELAKTEEFVAEQYKTSTKTPVTSRIIEDRGVWVNKRSMSMREEQLPAVLKNEIGISFAKQASLKDISELVSRETGLRFSFSPDVVKEARAPLLNAGFTNSGELRALLNRVTAQADMSWRFNEGAVEVFRYDTKVFQIAALPGITSLSANVSNKNTGGQSTTASSGQDVKFDARTDFWAGLKNDVRGLITGAGTYSVSEANSTLTVTGTPQVLASVESYVKNMNALRMRQVVLDVHVYKVDLDSSRDFGVALNAVFNELSKNLGITIDTPSISSGTAKGIGVTLGSSSTSKFAGSKIMLSALNTIGTTTVETESNQRLLSGESAAINSLREITYLAEVTSTVNANAAPSIALKPGTTTEGFAMTLTPSISAGDYVMLSGTLELSTIDSLNTQASGGQQITTPNRSIGSQLLRVAIKTGETYLYALRQNSAGATDSGMVGTSTLLTPLGGAHNSKSGQRTLVITITPHIINPRIN